jgi:hypothetical protein
MPTYCHSDSTDVTENDYISFHFGCKSFVTKFEMLWCKMILKQKVNKVINKCHFDVFPIYFKLDNTK